MPSRKTVHPAGEAPADSGMQGQKPLVGVFVTRSSILKLRARERIATIDGLRQANREAKTALFFFSIEDVNLQNQTISGTYFDEARQRWRTDSFSLPDVLYNRRSEGDTLKIKAFRELVGRQKIKAINPVNDFDKWELYRFLSLVPGMPAYLPHTVRYSAENDVAVMLDRFKAVYLKATIGRYSRQVARIKLREDGLYEYSYVADRLRMTVTESWGKVVQFWRTFFGSKEFIIQEAIRVVDLNGRSVDMRAELQRNSLGDLEIIAISARLAAPNSPVSSTRAGAAVFQFADFFRKHFDCSEQELCSLMGRVNGFLGKVFTSVEHIYGVFGDMGIDFALDRKANLWLIECNAKSAKVALVMSYSQPVIYRSFLNPLEYAKFLAGTRRKGVSRLISALGLYPA